VGLVDVRRDAVSGIAVDLMDMRQGRKLGERMQVRMEEDKAALRGGTV
jgi:hypothetical protein